MADVYVQAGEVKKDTGFPKDKFDLAKKAAAAALADYIANRSGMTATKPRDGGAGVLANVILKELVTGTNTMTCRLIGEFFELPSKERLKIDVTPSGEGKWTGGQGDALTVCVQGAVKAMMDKSARTITAPKPSAATTGQIYIAPFEVTYPDAKKAPKAIGDPAIKAAKAAMDTAATKYPRVVRDNYQSGMAGFTVIVAIQEVTVDTTAKTAAIKFRGEVNTYPDGTMFSLGFSSKASLSADVSDRAIIETIAGLAGDAADTALKAILAKI